MAEARHARRRLTSAEFFARYDKILIPDGTVEFKTDNKDLFDFSVEEVKEAEWKLTACTYDLHHDAALNEGNVMTEYEERFSKAGNPICKLIARKEIAAPSPAYNIGKFLFRRLHMRNQKKKYPKNSSIYYFIATGDCSAFSHAPANP